MPTCSSMVSYILAIGTDPVQLSNLEWASNGVDLYPDGQNAGNIFIGGSSVSAISGKPMNKGESINIPIDNPSNLYAVADTAGQNLYVTVYQ